MTKSVALTVGVHEAKTRLSELLRLVDGGQEVEIARGGHPVARLVPVMDVSFRELGLDTGAFVVPDDFDEPMAEIADPFYA